MKIRSASSRVAALLVASALLSVIDRGFAADAPAAPVAAPAEPSKEMRAKMATMHERMAACLRSDKTFADCRAEAMQYCQANMGSQGCMGMGMGHGMGMHGGMQAPPPENPPKK
jgi:hypothetical protein